MQEFFQDRIYSSRHHCLWRPRIDPALLSSDRSASPRPVSVSSISVGRRLTSCGHDFGDLGTASGRRSAIGTFGLCERRPTSEAVLRLVSIASGNNHGSLVEAFYAEIAAGSGGVE